MNESDIQARYEAEVKQIHHVWYVQKWIFAVWLIIYLSIWAFIVWDNVRTERKIRAIEEQGRALRKAGA